MEIGKVQLRNTFVVMLIFHFLLACTIAAMFWGTLDIIDFNYSWGWRIAHNIFSIYDNSLSVVTGPDVDYPPVFPMLLGIVGKICMFLNIDMSSVVGLKRAIVFLLLKFFQIISVEIFAIFIYKKVKGISALIINFLILFNPAFIFNISFWGQADIFIVELIFLSFFYLFKNNYLVATIWFAVGCLTKLQFLYFLPVFFLIILIRTGVIKSLVNVVEFGIVMLAGWLPFIIHNRDLFLPLKIYFGGFAKYLSIQMNAFSFSNLFVFLSGNEKKQMTNSAIGSLTYSQLNYVILGVIVLLAIYFIIKNKTNDMRLLLITLIYSLSLFMFTFSQHERYEIPALGILLVIIVFADYYKMKIERLQLGYTLLSIGIFLNQLLIYVSFTISNFVTSNRSMIIFSAINVIFAFVSVPLITKSLDAHKLRENE